MQIQSKYKVCKRLGSSVFEKCQTQKFLLSEERSARNRPRGGRRPKALSNFGRQLLEKQRVRFTYGVSERQLSRYAKEARTGRGLAPASLLFRSLEMRLDNVVFRMGLAKTRRLARQMVSHGHIMLNGKKTTIPSATVREGDAVAVREESKKKTLFTDEILSPKEEQPPAWLAIDNKTLQGSVQGTPTWDSAEAAFDLREVLEFYSK